MIKNNRGVALATLVIAVLIMLTVSGTIIYTTSDTMKLRKLDDMYNDIQVLNQKVTNYYIENNVLPILDGVNISKKELPEDLRNLITNGHFNNNDNYQIIDLEKLGGITLKYGKDYKDYSTNNSKTDFYIINESSQIIYYLKGITINGKTKYVLEETYAQIDLPGEVTPEVPSIEIIGDKNEIYRGEWIQLEAKVLPENTTNKEIIWSTSDYQIAWIDEIGGLIEGGKSGTATITATLKEDDEIIATDTYEITVIEPVIEADYTTIEINEELYLYAEFVKSFYGKEEYSISWESEDENIVKIIEEDNENGHAIIKGWNCGTTKVRAIITGGGGEITAEIEITVEGIANMYFKDECDFWLGVSEDRDLLPELVLEDSNGNILENTYENTAGIIWSSSDESIACVDFETGLVTGLSEGTVTITATKNSLEASIDLYVREMFEISLIDRYYTKTFGSITVLNDMCWDQWFKSHYFTVPDGFVEDTYIINKNEGWLSHGCYGFLSETDGPMLLCYMFQYDKDNPENGEYIGEWDFDSVAKTCNCSYCPDCSEIDNCDCNIYCKVNGYTRLMLCEGVHNEYDIFTRTEN